MIHATNLFHLPATLLFAIAFSAPAAGSSYKWSDSDGIIHYGDRVPPEHSSKERRVLNEQGITVKIYDASKTPEQIAEEQRLAKLKEEEEHQKRIQTMYDHTLLATFASEQDMVSTRDGKISAIEGIIRLSRSRVENIKSRLHSMTLEAAELERSGRPFPVELHRQIRETRKQILENERYILSKQQEQEAIRQQFEADIQRFRKLKSEAGVAAKK